PIARDDGECDQKGKELRSDRRVEVRQALEGLGPISDVERCDQQRQRDGERRVDEGNRAIELGLLARVPHPLLLLFAWSPSRDRRTHGTAFAPPALGQRRRVLSRNARTVPGLLSYGLVAEGIIVGHDGWSIYGADPRPRPQRGHLDGSAWTGDVLESRRRDGVRRQ